MDKVLLSQKAISSNKAPVMDRFPFERLPPELRIQVYLAIDDEPIQIHCKGGGWEAFVWLCSKGNTTSMSPKALLTLARVSRSIRSEVARVFTAGQYGMKAVFEQSMAVFRGMNAMSTFVTDLPKMAREVRAAMVIGWQRPYDGTDEYYESAFSYWESQAGLPESFVGIFDKYPAMTRVELRRAQLGTTEEVWLNYMSPWTPGVKLDLRRGYVLHQEGEVTPREGREPVKIIIYREKGEKIPPKALLDFWGRRDNVTY
ncbi:hypothetical protein MMC10_006691 [Thelotrema lepadinum]|nr:hypothetical protein [Thelotrema lepadinum]